MKLFIAILIAACSSITALAQSQSVPLNVFGSPERSRALITEPLAEPPQITLWKTVKLFVFRQTSMTEGFSGPFRFAVDLPTSQWFSFPIVSEGRVVFIYQGSDDAFLYAVDATSGKPSMVLKFPGVRLSAPAVHGSKIFFGDNKGVVHAVDVTTRTEIWSVEQKGRPANIAPPIVDDESLFIYFGESGLHAIDLENGNAKWTFKSSDDAQGFAVNNDRVAMLTARGTLIGIDKKTGAKQWEAKADSDASAPLIAGDQVFIRFKHGEIRAYALADGSVRWKAKPSGGTGTVLAATKQLILFSGREHSIVAVDAATGEEKWKFKTNNPCSHPLVAGDLVYALCEDKKFYAIDVTSGKEKWRLENKTATWFMSSFADGVMYVLGADGFLTAMK